MSELYEQIKDLIRNGRVRISEHGFDELSDDGLSAREAIAGAGAGIVIEVYQDYPKGPCLLVLEHDQYGRPFHAVWGIPKGYTEPAVLVTAYRPNPEQWDASRTKRNS